MRLGEGGLLSGHVSSTDITQRPEEGTLPRTAAEALAAMQSQLAAESSATHPQTTDFSSPKAPDTQVPPVAHTFHIKSLRPSSKKMQHTGPPDELI